MNCFRIDLHFEATTNSWLYWMNYLWWGELLQKKHYFIVIFHYYWLIAKCCRTLIKVNRFNYLIIMSFPVMVFLYLVMFSN